MKYRSTTLVGPVGLGLSVFMLAGSIGAVTASSIADATAREQSRAERTAVHEITKARAALAKKNIPAAIAHAEAAVTLQPEVAEYRMTLGQSYVRAGRFVSARDAFADALSLSPANGKAALQFALMQIGTGDWAGARATLDTHASIIPVSDRGLGMALAGDPVAAVDLLDPAARATGADAKTRQNFALSLALAGRWRDAQSVVEIDLAPIDAARRLLQWATFARPNTASDQIAALLGVVPVADAGQPSALALNRKSTTAVAALDASSDGDDMVREPLRAVADVHGQPATVAVAALVAPVPANPAADGIVFAPPSEVVQALPVAVAAHVTTTRTVTTVRAQRQNARGNFYVQLGAYDTQAVAQDAWIRAGRRFAALSGHVPQGMGVARGGVSFYRLSIGGFTKEDATALCRSYRAKGGNCFVRAGAGDQIAAWASRRELALR